MVFYKESYTALKQRNGKKRLEIVTLQYLLILTINPNLKELRLFLTYQQFAPFHPPVKITVRDKNTRWQAPSIR